MANPLPEEIIIAQLAAWLGDISRANGYYTDAGAHVHTEEPDPINDPDLPTLLVLDEEASSGGKVWRLRLSIECLLQVEPNNARAACRRLQTDVVNALRKGARAGEQDTSVMRVLRITGKEIPRREPGETIMAPTVAVEVEYHDPA